MSRIPKSVWFLLSCVSLALVFNGCKPRTGPCTTCPQPPADTLTATPSGSPTATETWTPTGTWTTGSPTDTPTKTPTFTLTCPCLTGTPTPTYTFIDVTNTWTPSPTKTATPASPTATWTPTLTDSPSPYPTGCYAYGNTGVPSPVQFPVDAYVAQTWNMQSCGATLTGLTLYVENSGSTLSNLEVGLYHGTTRIYSGGVNPAGLFSGWVTLSVGPLVLTCGDDYTFAAHSLSSNLSVGQEPSPIWGCQSDSGNYFSLLPATLPFTTTGGGTCHAMALILCGDSGTPSLTPTNAIPLWTDTPTDTFTPIPSPTWTPSRTATPTPTCACLTGTPTPTPTTSPTVILPTPCQTPGIVLGETATGTLPVTFYGTTCQMFTVTNSITVSQLSIDLAVSPTNPVVLGIYNNSGSYPNFKLTSSTPQAMTAGLNTVTLSGPYPLAPGTYWLAAACADPILYVEESPGSTAEKTYVSAQVMPNPFMTAGGPLPTPVNTPPPTSTTGQGVMYLGGCGW